MTCRILYLQITKQNACEKKQLLSSIMHSRNVFPPRLILTALKILRPFLMAEIYISTFNIIRIKFNYSINGHFAKINYIRRLITK